MQVSLFNKKAAPGWALTLLGVLGILLNATGLIDGLPGTVITVAEVITFLFTALGLRELLLQKTAVLIEKIIGLKASSTLFSILIEIVGRIATDPDGYVGLPEELQWVFRIISGILLAIGLGRAAYRGNAFKLAA